MRLIEIFEILTRVSYLTHVILLGLSRGLFICYSGFHAYVRQVTSKPSLSDIIFRIFEAYNITKKKNH